MEKLTQITELPPKNTITCKADSGASSHYVAKQDEQVLLDPVSITNGPKVRLPNNDQIQANKKG